MGKNDKGCHIFLVQPFSFIIETRLFTMKLYCDIIGGERNSILMHGGAPCSM